MFENSTSQMMSAPGLLNENLLSKLFENLPPLQIQILQQEQQRQPAQIQLQIIPKQDRKAQPIPPETPPTPPRPSS